MLVYSSMRCPFWLHLGSLVRSSLEILHVGAPHLTVLELFTGMTIMVQVGNQRAHLLWRLELPAWATFLIVNFSSCWCQNFKVAISEVPARSIKQLQAWYLGQYSQRSSYWCVFKSVFQLQLIYFLDDQKSSFFALATLTDLGHLSDCWKTVMRNGWHFVRITKTCFRFCRLSADFWAELKNLELYFTELHSCAGRGYCWRWSVLMKVPPCFVSAMIFYELRSLALIKSQNPNAHLGSIYHSSLFESSSCLWHLCL